MLDRIIKNWKTSAAAVVAGVVAIGVWAGTNIDPAPIAGLLSALYGVLLLFAKD